MDGDNTRNIIKVTLYTPIFNKINEKARLLFYLLISSELRSAFPRLNIQYYIQ